jgi:hypothetical protein
MNRQPVLVHYHIFKNAGSSVDASLKASFGKAWAPFEGAHAHHIRSSAELAQFLDNNPHLKAVSSHLARPPLPWPDCLPVVFLRHPLLRARSVYQFTRQDSSQPFADVARDTGFADYIRWALRGERGSIVIRNYQVVHLSEASWRSTDILDAKASRDDLKQACDLLSTWGVVGIVEEYARSAAAFQNAYGSQLPGLTLANVRKNQSTAVSSSMEKQLELAQLMLGNGLYEDFMAHNALDLNLYAHARKILCPVNEASP